MSFKASKRTDCRHLRVRLQALTMCLTIILLHDALPLETPVAYNSLAFVVYYILHYCVCGVNIDIASVALCW